MQITSIKNETLSLQNDGQLAIFFLGTGSAFSKRFSQTNFLVIKGETHLLVDCGSTASWKLHYFNKSLLDIKNYHITHSHADHIGGLEEAMLSHRYLSSNGEKPKIIITPEYANFLWEYSLRGGNAYSEIHQGKPLRFEDFWELLYMEKLPGTGRELWEYQLENLNLKMPRTCHFPSNVETWKDSTWSTGLILDESVFLTSDTKYDPELLSEYDEKFDIKMIFHDCQLFTGGIHASLEELKQLPENLKKKTILMHYGDDIERYIDTIRDYSFHSAAISDVYYNF